MNKSNLTASMFLMWNNPGGLLSWPYKTEVKVLELDVKCLLRYNALGFSIIRISDGAILQIAYERLDEFSPLPETEISELRKKIARMTSDDVLQEKLNETRRQHEELISLAALIE